MRPLYKGASTLSMLVFLAPLPFPIPAIATAETPSRPRASAFQAKLVASDASASDLFGQSIGISGNTVIVGSPFDDPGGATDAGSAYIYVRNGTTWSQQAKLIASDRMANDHFGVAVAIDGDYAVVGANLDRSGSINGAGSAYVFVRSGTDWTQQTRLFALDTAANDQLGTSVAISGNTIVVGAPWDDHTATDAGSAYVFARSGTIWAQQQKLTAADAATSDNFGASIAISGNIAVVGVPSDDHAAVSNAGSAYVFVRSGTVWSQETKLTASDASAADQFGGSVAISGSTALIGSTFDDNARGADAGAAYAFVRSGITWSEQSKLTASNGEATDRFGVVAIDGNLALIGAVLGQGTNAGSAYVFTRTGTLWTEAITQVIAPDAMASDQFGAAVAASGGTAVVSAPYHDVAANLNAGASYVFDQLDPVPAIAPLGLAVLGFTILAAGARGLRRRGLRFDSLRT